MIQDLTLIVVGAFLGGTATAYVLTLALLRGEPARNRKRT